MSYGQETAKCPKCKESVLPGATKCKHCGSEIKTGKKTWYTKYNNFRAGFLSGILFTLCLVVLAVLYIYGDL